MLKFPRFILSATVVYFSLCAFVVATGNGDDKPPAYLLPGVNAIEVITNNNRADSSISGSDVVASKSKQYLTDIRANIENYKSGAYSRELAEKAWQE